MIYLTEKKKVSGYRKKKTFINSELFVEKKDKNKQEITYKLAFITLTLSSVQDVPDEIIKKAMLNHFLVEIKRKYNVENYIWKAEKQDNGNIHFHVLIDKYIYHDDVRKLWNSIQNKAPFHYVDKYSIKMQEKYKNGFKPDNNSTVSIEIQRKRFEIGKNTKWTNPNSTDIHALKSIKNAAAYITKYLSKGVSKSSRIDEMKELYRLLVIYDKYITKLKMCVPNYISFPDKLSKLDMKLNYVIDVKNKAEQKLNELKKMGVSGRIYGISQNLSKIKGFTDVEEKRNIPDIDIIEKIHRHKSIMNINNNSVITYYFDISKTPELNKILQNSLKLE